MAYKQSVYIKAKTELDLRRAKAERIQQQHRAEALLKVPELAVLEREMAGYGTEAIKLIGHGIDAEGEIRKLAVKSAEVQQKRKEVLKKAGFPENYLEADYVCPICHDTGAHDGYYCSCYENLILETARKELCSIEVLESSSFDKFSLNYYPIEIDASTGVSPRHHMSDVLKFCRNFVDSFSNKSRGIFMFGKTGLGKTHLSLAIADEITKKGYNVYYSSVQNVLTKLEKEHFSRNGDEAAFLDEILEADLLILDDLGAEFATSFTRAQIYNIINSRIIDNRPTVISTNLSLDEIEESYTQRVTSRILGSFTPLRFLGADIRQIKAFGN